MEVKRFHAIYHGNLNWREDIVDIINFQLICQLIAHEFLVCMNSNVSRTTNLWADSSISEMRIGSWRFEISYIEVLLSYVPKEEYECTHKKKVILNTEVICHIKRNNIHKLRILFCLLHQGS